MIIDPKKKAAILKAPRQITPLSSPVSMSADVGRVNARMSEPGIRRKA